MILLQKTSGRLKCLPLAVVIFLWLVLFLAVSLLYVVVDLHLVAEDLGESLHVVGSPSLNNLSVLAEVAAHEVEVGLYAYECV